MRESRRRMSEEESTSSTPSRDIDSPRRSSSSRSRSHPRSSSRQGPDRSQSLGANRRLRELPSPFLLSSRDESLLATIGQAASARDERGPERRTNPLTHEIDPNGISPRSEAPHVSDPGNAETPQTPTLLLMSQRGRRTFARPWSFEEIFSDWSLASIHRIFWLSVAFIHIGIFLLFVGGFFHKTPSGLASSLVSLGIFILSCGLAMYTLAKTIIRNRARQCQRVLQVVLDLVDPPVTGHETSVDGRDADRITGVVGAPPPYEAPPPYPGQLHTRRDDDGDDCVVVLNDPDPSSSNQKPEDDVNLPPAYSTIDISVETNSNSVMMAEDLPPAYSERL